jgi:hypothetical protein
MVEHLPTAAGAGRANDALLLELPQETLAGATGYVEATAKQIGGYIPVLVDELSHVLQPPRAYNHGDTLLLCQRTIILM